ncbi:MAG: hypothetical protein, partial [Olavius algarvensis Gamma 1 endosymbiont]
ARKNTEGRTVFFSVSSVFSVDPLFFIRVDSCAFVVLRQQNVTKRGASRTSKPAPTEQGFFRHEDKRVVPLDNFMIYKDIIRLDRPD